MQRGEDPCAYTKPQRTRRGPPLVAHNPTAKYPNGYPLLYKHQNPQGAKDKQPRAVPQKRGLLEHDVTVHTPDPRPARGRRLTK